MDEALGPCAKACMANCPHAAHGHAEPHLPPAPAQVTVAA
jgi:hypothetical protein